LLYYKPVQRVIDCQKELAEIVDLTKNEQEQLSDNSDQIVLKKLKDMGYKDFDHQKLFEVFYENDEFREKVFAEIEKYVIFPEGKKIKLYRSRIGKVEITLENLSPTLVLHPNDSDSKMSN
jgi:hypothetical protein